MLKSIRKSRGFTLIELMIVVAIIGILAAIAIPNFIKFQAKSKQSEAKTNLKAIFTAEKSYYGEKDTYHKEFSIVGFKPERGNRYTYQIGGTDISYDSVRFPTAPTAAAKTATSTSPSGTTAVTPNVITGSQGTFAARAYGNVDNDTESDEWAVGADTMSGVTTGTCAPDATAPGGAPIVMYDDVACP